MIGKFFLISFYAFYQQMPFDLPRVSVVEFGILNDFKVPYFEAEIEGTKQLFLMDTGVQTFVLDMSEVRDFDLEWDGTGQSSELDGGSVTLNFVRQLHITWDNFKFSAQFGLAYDYEFFERLKVVGAINPSQLAHNGCILINFQNNKVIIQEYDGTGVDKCLLYDGYKNYFEFGHDYIAKQLMMRDQAQTNRSVRVAIDSGYSRSTFSDELHVCDDANYDSIFRAVGFGHVTNLAVIPEQSIYFQDSAGSESELSLVSLCQKGNFPPEVDVILGYDFLKDKLLLVGKDLPPRILMDEF